MHVAKVIEQLGYKRNEVKVYLAVLAMGESTVSSIAERVQLPRTSVKILVDSLHIHGLLSCYAKQRYRYWVAENPERLLIKEKEREAALRAVMPELSALRHRSNGKPTIKVFTGAEEIKLIHDDIIASRHSLLAIISWDAWVELFGQPYISDFIVRRKQHFLNIRLLVPKSDLTAELRKNDREELRVTRFLPERITFATTQFIYANKIALITANKKQPTGIVLEDPDIRHTLEIFFEEMWKLGT